MTSIAGPTGRAEWRINANGSPGILNVISSDNIAIEGTLAFDDTAGRIDRIIGTWNDSAGEIAFTRILPNGITQTYTGFLGGNYPDRPLLAGSFTQSDVLNVPRSQFGWFATRVTLPLDLVWDVLDDNGFPKNPRWAYQIAFPWSVPNPGEVCRDISLNCTSQQPTTDTATICKFGSGQVFGIAGHLNWFGVTYEGPVFWTGKSPSGEDDDYNFNLIPFQGAGLTSGGNGAIGLEFDSDDTIDHFNTPWWTSFHAAVDDSDAKARVMVDGRQAIVSGLYGLDCPHSANSEIHPVWALAILVEDTLPEQLWAMYVMNWGNEGFCGSADHQVNLSSYSFRLPWILQATSVEVMWNATHFLANSSQITGPNVQFAKDQGVIVNFTLPSPSTHPRVNGEIRLRWQLAAPSPSQLAAPSPSEIQATIKSVISTQPQHRPATVFANLVGQITPEQRRALESRMSRPPVVADQLVPPSTRRAMEVDQLPLVGIPAVHPVKSLARERAVTSAFKEVLGWKIPDP
jgi:hypothetical protein